MDDHEMCSDESALWWRRERAIRVDRRVKSSDWRACVQAFARIIGPDRDIPGPDVYTNSMIMGWMADEYASIVGESTPAVITGKPIALGGSLGREDATARGGCYVVRHLAGQIGLHPRARVAIEGFGNVGRNVARLLAAEGCILVAVSDSGGAVYRSSGLDLDQLLGAKERGSVASLAGSGGVTAMVLADLFAVDCDLLVPAALENSIHNGNAGNVKARIILELANGPITPAADDILAQKRVGGFSRHSGQCWRRDRIVFRMGSEPPGSLLDDAEGACPTEADDGK